MTTVIALLLVVRVFDRSGDYSLQGRQAALHAANAIPQQADVTTRWVDYSNAGTPAAPACGDRIAWLAAPPRAAVAAPRPRHRTRNRTPAAGH